MDLTKDFPRRNKMYLNTPAEKAIYNAIQEVEKIGADIRLTEATNLLSKAKELVGDFVDGETLPPQFPSDRIEKGVRSENLTN